MGALGAPASQPTPCRGVTEGVTLLLLALQTGLLDLQVLQRTFLLSIILFIVVTSTLQSMIEIADPIVLALGASRNRYPARGARRGAASCRPPPPCPGGPDVGPGSRGRRSGGARLGSPPLAELHPPGASGSISAVSACASSCWSSPASWPTRSHASSTWTSGCSSWSPAACSPPCRYGGPPAPHPARVPGDAWPRSPGFCGAAVPHWRV